MRQVETINDTEELRARVDQLLPERFDMGFRKATYSLTLLDVPDLVTAVAHHTLFVVPRAELDQFREGRSSQIDLFCPHKCTEIDFFLLVLQVSICLG